MLGMVTNAAIGQEMFSDFQTCSSVEMSAIPASATGSQGMMDALCSNRPEHRGKNKGT